MKYFRFIASMIIFALFGCSDSEQLEPFPSDIKYQRGESAVDAVEEFVQQRYLVLDRAFLGFEQYVNSRMNQEALEEKWFTYTHALESEDSRGTKQIVTSSPTKVYMSDEEQRYINLMIRARQGQIENKIKRLTSDYQRSKFYSENKSELRMAELVQYFVAAPKAKKWISSRSADDYESLTRYVMTEVEALGEEELKNYIAEWSLWSKGAGKFTEAACAAATKGVFKLYPEVERKHQTEAQFGLIYASFRESFCMSPNSLYVSALLQDLGMRYYIDSVGMYSDLVDSISEYASKIAPAEPRGDMPSEN